MSGARKLAAILAVDIAGYSRLMGEDEAGTAKLMRKRREAAMPIVRAFDGRLVKTTGDGVLLEFPSVVGAVECAILIQKMMAERNAAPPETKRILYRIGVNLGDVLIEDDDILGDCVNVATRLEGICEPGGVCVSGSAYEAQVEAREPVAVSSASAPVSVRREPPRLSLIVLPFANIGGDPEQEYFVDGVTDGVTTDLSRIRGAFVIARSTAFTFKGKPIDVRAIGHELNVRYALEGSVQRRGDRIRVNVQLLDAQGGSHLWAERFDKPLADFFEMQDEIVARLGSQLGVELIRAEAGRSERTQNPDALDLVFQGMAWSFKGRTPENVTRARAFFERVLTLDPNNVTALVFTSLADLAAARNFHSDDAAARLTAAETAATKALSLAPENAFAHFSLAGVFAQTRRTGDRPLRAGAGAQPKLRLRAGAHRLLQGVGWTPRGDRGSRPKGPAAQSSRCRSVLLAAICRRGKDSPRPS